MIFFILFFVSALFAEELTPMWVQDSWRDANYSGAEWYTGFARDKINGTPDKEKFKIIEKDAQNSLAGSIVVKVQSNSSVERTEEQRQSGKDYTSISNTNYKQAITSSTNAVLAKVKTYSHFDKQSGYIYGFATVKKKDLEEFYTSKINSLFSFAENELSLADQLAQSGKKKSALNKIKPIEDSLQSIPFWKSLLQAIENNASDFERENLLWQQVNNKKIELENGNSIYFDITGNKGAANELSAMLQEKNCNCSVAETANEADYTIKSKIKLDRCNKTERKEVYCYANATVSLTNVKANKTINLKVPEAKGGWANGDKDKATKEAFRELTENMAESILKELEK